MSTAVGLEAVSVARINRKERSSRAYVSWQCSRFDGPCGSGWIVVREVGYRPWTSKRAISTRLTMRRERKEKAREPRGSIIRELAHERVPTFRSRRQRVALEARTKLGAYEIIGALRRERDARGVPRGLA